MNGYCYFILGILALAVGYFTYGRVLERIFRPDASRQTPAVACTDGVDYVVMPRWRVFLIQLLNIAGLGPIFGAVMGVLYGPAALLWIVFGCILGGMAHDYFSGMISLRHKGENLPEILGRYLGRQAQWISRAVCIVFSVLVGVVFAVGPAAILSPMTGWSVSAWVWMIFGYYFLATILPIQAIMGKVYPLFSVALIIMVMGILGVMLLAPFADSMPAWMHLPRMEVLPDLDFFHNRHPADFPLFPVMFITIACGAVSGFHATQSPLMARCLKTEREGLPVFGGAMITEGIIAFIWAAAALTFYGSPEALGAATANGKAPALAIQMISESWMGHVGSILVMVGVVILPISTGGRRPAGHAPDDCGLLQAEPGATEPPPDDRHPPLCRSHCRKQHGLRHHLAVLRLGQPAPGRRHPLGRLHLPAQQKPLLLDGRRSRRLPEPGGAPVPVLQPGNVRVQL